MPITLARTSTIAALAILTGAVVAHANPVTWYTSPGTINSRGLLGNANNATVSLPMPAVPAGGGASWSYLTVSGNLTKVNANTFASEACIEVTLPGGSKFVIKPFETGGFAGTIAIPSDSHTASPYPLFSSAGQCTLRFFELFADSASGPDSTWNNLTVTLHDSLGNDPYPFSASIDTYPANPDEDTDGNWFTKGQPVNGELTGFATDRIVSAFRFKGYGTAMCGWNANTSASPLSFVRYTFTADRADGAGPVSWTVDPFESYASSTADFNILMATPVPVFTGPSHPWTYTLAENDAAPVAVGTRIAAVWLGIQPLGPGAPDMTYLGFIRGKPTLGPAETTVVETQTFVTLPHGVKWYTFSTQRACTAASGFWLDIHTRTVAGSPIVDQELALYSEYGQPLALDDDGGSGNQAMLTFGAGSPVRAPIDPAGSPSPRDGHDGALPAGFFYLAVPQFNTNFGQTSWYMDVQGAQTGAIAFDIRTNLPPAPCGPADIGSAGGVAGSDGTLDNNDFIAFIASFFSQSPSADIGVAGGLMGSDWLWDNNDFIAFITLFFNGCP